MDVFSSGSPGGRGSGSGSGGCRCCLVAAAVAGSFPGWCKPREDRSHADHGRFGPQLLPCAFSRRETAGVCVGSQRRGQPGYLGAADRRWRAGPTHAPRSRRLRTVVLARRHADRVLLCAARSGIGGLRHPGALGTREADRNSGPYPQVFTRWTVDRLLQRRQDLRRPIAGGAPRQLLPEFLIATNPVWFPDGKRLLVVGNRAAPGSYINDRYRPAGRRSRPWDGCRRGIASTQSSGAVWAGADRDRSRDFAEG